jgi:preprotein translocase subunit SecA
VANRQRETIYALRSNVLEGKNLQTKIQEMLKNVAFNFVTMHVDPASFPDKWDQGAFVLKAQEAYPLADLAAEIKNEKDMENLKKIFFTKLNAAYLAKEASVGREVLREIERLILLRVLDNQWIDHLHNMDILREGIGLRAYGQRDPLIEYKIEAFKMFEALMEVVEEDTISDIFKAEIVTEERPNFAEQALFLGGPENLSYNDPEALLAADPYAQPVQEQPKAGITGQTVVSEKVGRNEPCPCGSGKKYKKCCGKNT